MKRILSIVLGSLSVISLKAQEPADALRYSWYVPGGTARVKAVGGAMGSLGGDLTATFVNPAGIAFFKTGDIVMTPQYQFRNTKTNYLGNTEKAKGDKFTWGTTGFVIGGGSEGKNVRNSAISIAYNRTADFNSNVYYLGKNNQSSYSQKYLEEIGSTKDGNVVANDFPYGASLAFNTYWLDTVGGGSSGNYQFQSRSKNILSTGLLQQNAINTRGGIDEFALGVAVNLKDKWMVGGSFGVPVLSYRKTGEFIEADATDNPNNQFNYAIVEDKLKTKGVGVNFKAGAIYKPTEFWRIGLAIHSPSFFSLTDEYQVSVTTDRDRSDSVLSDYSIDYTNGSASEFKYDFFTPYRVIGSVSYVLREIQDVTKQKGFITADVEFVNYKASSFHPHEDEETTVDEGTKSYLKQLNKAIDKAYRGAFNFRVGGELKFTTIMVRLGAAYYASPYKSINGEKGSKLNLSGGLGYRNKGFFIDATYVHAINKDMHYAYRLQDGPYYGAQIKSNVGNVLLTVGIKI